MSSPIFIKAGSINNLSDARYFAAFGVAWMGFCLDPESKHFIAPAKAKEIAGWLSGPKIIGEFGGQRIAYIQQIISDLKLSLIQVNADFIEKANLKELNTPVIVKVRDVSFNALEELITNWQGVADIFLLGFGEKLWSDIKPNQKLLKKICQANKIILEMNFQPETVNEVIQQLNPYGINLAGGEEEQPGIKDFDDIEVLLEQLDSV